MNYNLYLSLTNILLIVVLYQLKYYYISLIFLISMLGILLGIISEIFEYINYRYVFRKKCDIP